MRIRLCLAAAALAAGPLAAATAAPAAAGSMAGSTAKASRAPATAAGGSTYFVATTSASAATVITTQKPASSIITAGLVNDSLGYTAIAYDSGGGSEAQAASVYPGTLVVQGPSLLCNEGVLPFSCPVSPPAYPLLADARYPQSTHATVSSPTGTVGSGTPLVARPGSSEATATADAARATTATGSSTLLGGTPLGFTVGSQSSHSSVVTTARAVTVRVVSRASDVTVGGLLHIGSVTGTDVQRLAAGRQPIDRPTVRVSNVTVAGHRATVDSKGLHVAGAHGPALLHRLSAQGITVDPVTVNRHDTRRGARSDTTGLVVTAAIPLKQAPYVPNPLSSVPPFDQIPGIDLSGTYISTVRLGGVGAAAGISHQADVGLGKLGKVPVTPPAAPPTSGGGGGSGAVPPGGGSGGAGGAPVPTVSGGPVGGGPRVAPAAGPVRLLADTTDLERLYLVIALGAAAIFAGWRLRLGDRLIGRLRSRRP